MHPSDPSKVEVCVRLVEGGRGQVKCISREMWGQWVRWHEEAEQEEREQSGAGRGKRRPQQPKNFSPDSALQPKLKKPRAGGKTRLRPRSTCDAETEMAEIG